MNKPAKNEKHQIDIAVDRAKAALRKTGDLPGGEGEKVYDKARSDAEEDEDEDEEEKETEKEKDHSTVEVASEEKERSAFVAKETGAKTEGTSADVAS